MGTEMQSKRLEAAAKLLCTEKSMILRPFASCLVNLEVSQQDWGDACSIPSASDRVDRDLLQKK